MANEMNNEVNNRVTLCPDGKYRWAYEVNLYKNPSMLIDLLKLVLFCILGEFVFLMVIIMFKNRHFGWGDLLSTVYVFFWIIVFLMVVSLISYFIWAKISGGKYAALFEMDEQGVVHKKMDKQVNKGQLIGGIAALAGALDNNPGLAGASMLAACVNSWKSEFKKVRHLIPVKRRNLIKVNERLTKNRVYVPDEDYDFVYNYILQRCTRIK